MDSGDNILEYKNFHLFYQNLYQRLFSLIDLLIDENEFNIMNIRNTLIDFLDNYSYYLVKRDYLTIEDTKVSGMDMLGYFKKFDEFYVELGSYPTKKYNKIRTHLVQADGDLRKLGFKDYKFLMEEYYKFYAECLKILKEFVSISSDSGFLPNIKKKSSTRNIGFANFDSFFLKLEEWKMKFSKITAEISVYNSLKARRCAYCLLIVFSAYFSNKELYAHIESRLGFDIIEDDVVMKLFFDSLGYDGFYYMGSVMQEDIMSKVIDPLKEDLSLVKRFTSYEFGELDMNPRIKKKYMEDPTGV